MMDELKTVGERIRELRKSYKLNQKDFAKPLGISYGHISNIEKGKDSPSHSLIKLMAHEYNTTEGWIKYGIGDMFTHMITSDISTMEKSNTLLFQLDDLLCESSASIRNLQENIIESLLLILKLNTKLKGQCQIDNLEILNHMLSKLYLFNNVLEVASKNSTELILSEKDKIEDLMDDIFNSFATELDDFKSNYIKDEY